MNTLKKIDILFAIYLFLSTVFVVLGGETTIQSQLLYIHLFIAILTTGLIILNYKVDHTFIKLLRETYPLIFSGYFYSETVFYNKLITGNVDAFLVKVEAALFKIQPSLEFSSFIPNLFFSELMYFGYFSFYLIILFFTLYYFFKKKKLFEKAIFQLSASLYIFYFIFSLLPSAGPQFYFTYPANVLPDAYLFHHIMHFIQNTAEQPTGAFPSSHVGISIIILMISRKSAAPFFKLAWPFVVLIVFSTVYIKAHYVIDVFAGLLIAPIVLYLSNILYQFPHIFNPNAKAERSKN